ncbi:cytochrome aa3 quinol oxidase subunit IV [Staphylococcus ratti]|uniref:Quinol oxidase subunit 4 n=1 Tax=Staphylococcus ratti TaxID=2892440 RepID=A0ABY3PFR3_9STAP|nr:cytochrome aa3 quinol oxidase subunit IV [Staphylococcus ratti]UEX91171.1 cytochrome aa3 quinol oxidase subunit IV [Staphylococcus ratti]
MKHTIGFIASIILTLLAVFVTLYTSLSFEAKVTIIFGFAFIQAFLQLLMFMHLTEGKDGRVQLAKVIFAIIITLVIVVGTFWVMQGGHSAHL